VRGDARRALELLERLPALFPPAVPPLGRARAEAEQAMDGSRAGASPLGAARVVLAFQLLGRGLVRFDLGVDLALVGVVVGQRAVDLSSETWPMRSAIASGV
jgi:hypothetical protein